MSNDSYTELSSQSWFSRIGNAFKGIVVGLILLVAAFGLLFWNEGRAVKRYKSLQEGASSVVSVQADSVDIQNEGRLVHLNGKAVTEDQVSDQQFGVSSAALKLERDVQMYQWQESSKSETKKKLGGSEETVTTYSYSKVWSGNPIQSGQFKKPDGHQNSGSMAYQSRTFTAGKVQIGAYTLSSSLVASINQYSPLLLDQDVAVPQSGATVQKTTNGFYFGASSTSPQIGDLKISYRVVLPTDVSLVARQTNSTFAPYQTSAGGSIELLEIGNHSAESMFETAQQSNTLMTWAIRGGGFLLMLIGLNMIFGPLAVLADIVPFFGSIVGVGTGIVSALVAAIFSLLTIGIAWIVYRPLLGIIFLGIAAAITALVIMKVKKTEPVPPPIPQSN